MTNKIWDYCKKNLFMNSEQKNWSKKFENIASLQEKKLNYFEMKNVLHGG